MTPASRAASPDDPSVVAGPRYSIEVPPQWAVLDVRACEGVSAHDVVSALVDAESLRAEDREQAITLAGELLESSRSAGADLVTMACFPRDGGFFCATLSLSWVHDPAGGLADTVEDMLQQPGATPLTVPAGPAALVEGTTARSQQWSALLPQATLLTAQMLVATSGGRWGAVVTGTVAADSDASLLASLVRRMAETLRLSEEESGQTSAIPPAAGESAAMVATSSVAGTGWSSPHDGSPAKPRKEPT